MTSQTTHIDELATSGEYTIKWKGSRTLDRMAFHLAFKLGLLRPLNVPQHYLSGTTQNQSNWIIVP